jgi:hypothetical protein
LRAEAVTETAIASPGVFALGTSLNRDGAVARDARSDHFVQGGEVLLSVDVRNASVDQTVGVIWRGPGGVVVHRESRPVPKGTPYVSFNSGSTAKWQRGDYHAAVVIDGRVVTQLEFTLV